MIEPDYLLNNFSEIRAPLICPEQPDPIVMFGIGLIVGGWLVASLIFLYLHRDGKYIRDDMP